MDLRDLFKNKYVMYSGFALARILPRKVGYAATKLFAEQVAEKKPNVYLQLRENLSHIPGTSDQLDELTKQAFINAGKFYFDFFHSVGKPVERIKDRVHIPQELFELFRSYQEKGQGILAAGIHTGNFDLGMISLYFNELNIQALSATDPNGGYEIQNRLRSAYGIEITPISPSSLREAVRRLRNGGIVAAGVDWPQPQETMLTEVFGKPAYIPTGTARLALLSNAVTIIIGFYMDENYQNHLMYSDPIKVIRTGNKDEDIKRNTEKYMEIFEDFVQQYPDQWLMYHKFWADE